MAYTAIDDPSAHFQTVLYTGNGSDDLSVTFGGNSDLQPDMLWFKNRNDTQGHELFDSTRGVATSLRPHNTDADNVDSPNDRLMSFDSDGFELDDDGNPNTDTNTYVAWGWKANGGSTSSNTSGTITSTVQADTTAGFSIITYTGNNTDGATFGHGLGAVPHFITIKGRSVSGNWMTYHTGLGADKAVFLDLDLAVESSSFYQETPTSTLVTLNNHGNVNADAGTYVAYCFTSIQGFSKFGSYTGNGDADGPMVFCGFKPAWLMIKRTDSTNTWYIWDNKRNASNVCNKELRANTDDAETTTDKLDFLSNGFKIRNTYTSGNADGGTYIYMAFAHQPFVSSGEVPCTAR